MSADKHLQVLQEHLFDDERIVEQGKAHLFVDGKAQLGAGLLFITTARVAFARHALLGRTFESIGLQDISSVAADTPDLRGTEPHPLEQITRLRDAGYLTDDEFEQKRAEIIARL